MLKRLINYTQQLLEAQYITNSIITDTTFSKQSSTYADVLLDKLNPLIHGHSPNWKPTKEMICAMLASPSIVIQQAVLDLANNNPNFFFRDAFFIEQLALAQPVLFSEFFQLKAKKFKLDSTAKSQTFLRLMTKMIATKWEEEAIILRQNIQSYFVDVLSTATLGQGMMLLKHPLENCKLLGTDILLAHKDRILLMPEAVVCNLLKSSSVPIQERGLAILVYSSLETILKNIPVLIELVVTGNTSLRAGLQSVVAQLADRAPLQAIVLMRYLLPLLLKREPQKGTHLFIVNLLNDPLKNSTEHLSTEAIYTLLESPYTAANTLGASLLSQIDLHQEPLSNIIWLADNELPAVRQFCFNYFTEYVDRIRKEKEEALRLLDARWVESRQFAFAFFTYHFEIADCSTQLLATGYLASTVHDNVAEFNRVKPYLTKVLTQLHKGHVAKESIFSFLEKEAIQNEATAQQILSFLKEIITRSQDKARCLQVVHKIHEMYPYLSGAEVFRQVRA